MPSLRACGARPSAGTSPRCGRPYGDKPGDGAKGGFLGGTHSMRPKIRAGSKPGHVTVTDGLAIGWWPKRSKVWIGAMSSLRACGARPSAGARPRTDGLAGNIRRRRGGRFSRRDAVSASAWYGRTDAEAFHLHPMMRLKARGLPGTPLGQANTFLAGVRSPPLRGDVPPMWTALR